MRLSLAVSARFEIALACVAALLVAEPAEGQWDVYEETSITGTVSGSIQHGHIFRTQSGHVYEVADYIYLYEYEYSPSVTVLSDGQQYKLIIDGFEEAVLCNCLNCGHGSRPGSVDSRVMTIKTVQAALTALGFEPGVMDGTLNEQTRGAVRRFRAAHDLVEADSLDSSTLRAVADALAKKYPNDSDALAVFLYLRQEARTWDQGRKEQGPRGSSLATPGVVESYISSDFNGLDYGNIYKLANGQVWEQTEYWIWVWVSVNPSVTIWNDHGVYRMKIQGIDHAVMVRRIK